MPRAGLAAVRARVRSAIDDADAGHRLGPGVNGILGTDGVVISLGCLGGEGGRRSRGCSTADGPEIAEHVAVAG